MVGQNKSGAGRASSLNCRNTRSSHWPKRANEKQYNLKFSWDVEFPIAYDIKRWNEVNTDPNKWNSGKKIEYLITWTIDDKSEMQRLAKMGVSAIITDYPEVLAIPLDSPALWESKVIADLTNKELRLNDESNAF